MLVCETMIFGLKQFVGWGPRIALLELGSSLVLGEVFFENVLDFCFCLSMSMWFHTGLGVFLEWFELTCLSTFKSSNAFHDVPR